MNVCTLTLSPEGLWNSPYLAGINEGSVYKTESENKIKRNGLFFWFYINEVLRGNALSFIQNPVHCRIIK